MSTENNAALAALNQAIELEIEGQRFYLEAAKCTTNPKGAEMFRSLADDEVIHERILRRQLDALTQGQGWMPVLSPSISLRTSTVEGLPDSVAEVTADLTALIFPESEKVCEEALRPNESDLDALLFALQIENKSFNLYREMVEKTEDPNGKRMYEYLANAERGHFEQLMLNYEHLSTTGNWAE
jgi:rubrerythrin